MKHTRGVWRRAAALVLAVMMAATAAGCHGKNSLPSEYQVDGLTVQAMTVPQEATLAETDSETFTYEGVTNAGSVAKSYTDMLIGADNGFTVVDDTYTQTGEPDFTQEEGQVFLAKAVEEEENKLLTVKVNWASDQCVVTLSTAEGTITVPSTESSSTMTDTQVVNFVKSLSPSVLGLSGDSMDSYQVYLMEGDVYVDGVGCKRVQVYSRDNPSNTNHFEGLYLVSGDGKHVYRQDPMTDETQALTLP